MKKYLSILGLVIVLLCVPLLSRAQDMGSPNTTISGKANLNIIGMTYDTLTLVNCFNVDLTSCTVKNLVMVRCWNIDVIDSVFVGEGVAVVADTCIAVAITRCIFAEAYSEKLIKMRSSLITIE